MPNNFSGRLNQRLKAVQNALDIGRTSIGVSTDPALRVYNRLETSDFADLAARFGPDAAMEYINNMEVKRLKDNSHG